MICKTCMNDKDAGDFYQGRRTCKSCVCVTVRAYRKANLEFYREYDRSRAHNDNRVAARAAYSQTDHGREALVRGNRAWRARNSEAYRAHRLVNNAIRDGRLIRASACQWAGCNHTETLHAHHADYDHPFDVVWLCPYHHLELHHGDRYLRRSA